MKIKICGLTSYEDAKVSLDLGADALGFNFYSGSPRYLAPDVARTIRAKLPATAWTVGIFCNHPIAEVVRIAHAVPLDTVQLHGDEAPTDCGRLGEFRVIKAFRLGPDSDIDGIQRYADSTAYYLFDALVEGRFGGTGHTVDGAVLDRLRSLGFLDRAFLSGGLNPLNVAAVIQSCRPFGVDVASGVEFAPRRKDKQLLQSFFEAARKA